MSCKIYTTNTHGEYFEKEIFPSEYLAGACSAEKAAYYVNRGFWGFGAAITGASCYNLSKLDAETRHALLKHLYTSEGLNLGVGRLTVGASDYSAELYTYDDVPNDTSLEHFSIDRDKAYIIPIVKEILAIKPNLKLFASPWTPPAWMKTGGSLGGGYMRRAYLECYAEYFVKYIKAYEAEGISICAVTVQNEPQTAQNGLMTACVWHPDLEAEFVSVLRGKFDENHIETQIWFHDHNFYDAERRVDWCLTEHPALAKDCAGLAFHYYEGAIEQTTYLKDKYPQLALHFTEGGPRLYDHYDTDWCKWGLMAVKTLCNRYSSMTGWNLMLDECGGPNIGPFFCGGLVTRGSADNALSYSGQYKAFKHFAHLGEDDSIYPITLSGIYPTMFSYPQADAQRPDGCVIEHPDGSAELVLVNPNGHKLQLQYRHKGQWYYIELLSDTVATVVFDA